jgi:hypothetical protein
MNRGLAHVQAPEEPALGAPLQTMHSSQNDQRHLLEEDLDEEMQSNFQVIPQRATDYEYAQTQEDKHLKSLMNSMPEAQIINSYKSLNQQLQANEPPSSAQIVGAQNARVDQIASTGSLRMQDNRPVTANAALDDNLFVKDEEQKE